MTGERVVGNGKKYKVVLFDINTAKIKQTLESNSYNEAINKFIELLKNTLIKASEYLAENVKENLEFLTTDGIAITKNPILLEINKTIKEIIELQKNEGYKLKYSIGIGYIDKKDDKIIMLFEKQ